MVDYKTNSSNLYLNANLVPSAKVRLHGTLSYNKSKSEYDPIEMDDPSARTVDSDGNPQMTHATYDFSGVHEYSNLDYTIVRFSGGFDYLLAKDITWTVDGSYADLTDDSGGWVYGE